MNNRAVSKPDDRAGHYHHGNLRETLLEAALGQLAERGAEQLSLRSLAREVGVSQTAPYRHFPDKEALLAELSAGGHRQLTRCLASARDLPAPALEKLRQAGRNYLVFARENPDLYKLMFGSLLPDPDNYPSLREAGRESFATLVEIVAEGIAVGQLRAIDPGIAAMACWTSVHGIASLLIDGIWACVEPQMLAGADGGAGEQRAAASVDEALVEAVSRAAIEGIIAPMSTELVPGRAH